MGSSKMPKIKMFFPGRDHPHPHVQGLPNEHCRRVNPPKPVVGPPHGIDDIRPVPTYVADGRVGKLAVPLVLDQSDLAILDMDVDLAVDQLLLTDALDLVEVAEVEGDGVAGARHQVGLALDLGEGGLETVLWLCVSSGAGLRHWRDSIPTGPRTPYGPWRG